MPSPKLSPTRRFSRILILPITFAAVMLTLSLVSQAETETLLYTFSESSGYGPYAGVVRDPAGNLYGTAIYGGAHNDGSAFELSPLAGGGWQETTIYSASDGSLPNGGLVIDPAGNLYGDSTRLATFTATLNLAGLTAVAR